jgi:hypothetical protein
MSEESIMNRTAKTAARRVAEGTASARERQDFKATALILGWEGHVGHGVVNHVTGESFRSWAALAESMLENGVAVNGALQAGSDPAPHTATAEELDAVEEAEAEEMEADEAAQAEGYPSAYYVPTEEEPADGDEDAQEVTSEPASGTLVYLRTERTVTVPLRVERTVTYSVFTAR